MVWIIFSGEGGDNINSCNSLLHLQAAPVRIVAQVSLLSVLWMVSPTTFLEERSVGWPRPITNSKQGARGSEALVLKEAGAGFQKSRFLRENLIQRLLLLTYMKANTRAKVRSVTVNPP